MYSCQFFVYLGCYDTPVTGCPCRCWDILGRAVLRFQVWTLLGGDYPGSIIHRLQGPAFQVIRYGLRAGFPGAFGVVDGRVDHRFHTLVGLPVCGVGFAVGCWIEWQKVRPIPGAQVDGKAWIQGLAGGVARILRFMVGRLPLLVLGQLGPHCLAALGMDTPSGRGDNPGCCEKCTLETND